MHGPRSRVLRENLGHEIPCSFDPPINWLVGGREYYLMVGAHQIRSLSNKHGREAPIKVACAKWQWMY